MKRALAIALCAAIYVRAILVPSWEEVTRRKSGSDFATYHYAALVAQDGGDPYDTAALSARASAEHTRQEVHPYFYPPPFLIGMSWDRGLSLVAAYRAAFWINQAALLAGLALCWAWFGAPPLLLAGLAILYTPFANNIEMGQANLPILALSLLGLWRGSGTLVGAAAMGKMSPALYLAMWAGQRRWRPVLLAMGTAVALSLLSLPWVGLDAQIRFYTQVLPRFAGGPYHDLTVPITLEANHSVADLYNQLWPGPDGFTLSRAARVATSATTLGLLGGLVALARRPMDRLQQANLAGAFTVLLLVTPVYTYEHHLVVLMLPLAALGTALWTRRPPAWVWVAAALAFFCVAHPLMWRERLQRELPALSWVFREWKFFGTVAVGALCAWVAARVDKRAGSVIESS